MAVVPVALARWTLAEVMPVTTNDMGANTGVVPMLVSFATVSKVFVARLRTKPL